MGGPIWVGDRLAGWGGGSFEDTGQATLLQLTSRDARPSVREPARFPLYPPPPHP